MMNNNQRKKILIFTVLAIMLIPLLLSGCKQADTGREPARQDLEKIPQASGTRFLMDTLVQMKVYGQNAQQVVEQSFDRLQEIEDEMSVSIESSEIYQINAHAGQTVKTSADTARVIKKSLEYAEMTNGRFDPSIGPLVQLWGIGTAHARVPSDQEIREARSLVNYHWIDFNADQQKIKLTRAGMQLDLGAIAKGYAADEVRQIFHNDGITSAYVNLGGNVLVVGGKPDGTPWRVGIQDPRKERGSVMASIDVRDKTIVTSGNYERYFEKDGVIYHHILDPKTGRPARTGILSASIITHDSFDADALSTSVFILGVDKGMELVNSLPGVEALIITNNLDIIESDGLKGKVKILNSDFKYRGGESGRD